MSELTIIWHIHNLPEHSYSTTIPYFIYTSWVVSKLGNTPTRFPRYPGYKLPNEHVCKVSGPCLHLLKSLNSRHRPYLNHPRAQRHASSQLPAYNLVVATYWIYLTNTTLAILLCSPGFNASAHPWCYSLLLHPLKARLLLTFKFN